MSTPFPTPAVVHPPTAAQPPTDRLAPLRQFVSSTTEVLAACPDEATALERVGSLLKTLLQTDSWLPDELARPDPQRYRQYLLHADPLGRFSVVSFVWGPGQATPIHDHTVWGLVGMLRGQEVSQAWGPDERGGLQPLGEAVTLVPGQVEAVSPRIGDIHRVHNPLADQVSISIHVYGANIGEVQRWTYAADGSRKAFVSGYSNPPLPALPRLTAPAVRERLLSRDEIALVDVREEDPFAQAHPLFAVQLPASRLELDAPWRLPRHDVCIAVYDDGEGLAEPAARRLVELGWTQVHLLDGGLAGWRQAGGELFRDVNVPSKAFGELVEHEVDTPSLPAEEVRALLDRGADVVVLDARRFDEYTTMSIPGGTSVPGAELVLRARDLAPDPATRIIVNCAGRTRSLIGTQTLINAGVPNPVAALRNGTIGWTLAGLRLEHGQQRRFGPTSPQHRDQARRAAQALATRAGAQRLDAAGLAAWAADPHRTLYRWDVRSLEEYEAGHLPGFGSAPGGQLVQETDVFAAVRGARIVLSDGASADPATDAGIRAPVTAHWLAQLGWEVAWLDDIDAAALSEHGPARLPTSDAPTFQTLSVLGLHTQLNAPGTIVIDLAPSATHVKGHIPGACWALRSDLKGVLWQRPELRRVVLTCGDGRLARWAAADLGPQTAAVVTVLEGGNAAWAAAGLPLEAGEPRLLSPRIDRYRRPYEGTDAPREAMQAYLDWEFGLVAQLARDGSHHFRVLGTA